MPSVILIALEILTGRHHSEDLKRRLAGMFIYSSQCRPSSIWESNSNLLPTSDHRVPRIHIQNEPHFDKSKMDDTFYVSGEPQPKPSEMCRSHANSMAQPPTLRMQASIVCLLWKPSQVSRTRSTKCLEHWLAHLLLATALEILVQTRVFF